MLFLIGFTIDIIAIALLWASAHLTWLWVIMLVIGTLCILVSMGAAGGVIAEGLSDIDFSD